MKGISFDEIVDPTGCPGNDLDTTPFEFLQIISKRFSSDAGVAVGLNVAVF